MMSIIIYFYELYFFPRLNFLLEDIGIRVTLTSISSVYSQTLSYFLIHSFVSQKVN